MIKYCVSEYKKHVRKAERKKERNEKAEIFGVIVKSHNEVKQKIIDIFGDIKFKMYSKHYTTYVIIEDLAISKSFNKYSSNEYITYGKCSYCKGWQEVRKHQSYKFGSIAIIGKEFNNFECCDNCETSNNILKRFKQFKN